jgi:hypothetical protein
MEKKETAMKSIVLGILLLLCAGAAVTAGADGLDKSKTGIVNGRVIYEGRDYGPLALGDTAYRRVLGDFIQETHKQFRQGFIAELVSFGQFYCFEKRNHSERENRSDIVQAAAGKWHQHMRPGSTDEAAMTDAVGELADQTLCPNGYPNPIQTFAWPGGR